MNFSHVASTWKAYKNILNFTQVHRTRTEGTGGYLFSKAFDPQARIVVGAYNFLSIRHDGICATQNINVLFIVPIAAGIAN